MTTSSMHRAVAQLRALRDDTVAFSDDPVGGLPGDPTAAVTAAKVAVVGRRALVAAAITATLRRGGHEVVSVVRPGEVKFGVRAIERVSPDIVVVDLDGQDGEMLGLVRAYRAAGHAVPVLVLTGQAGSVPHRQLFAAGANAALARDAAHDDLLRAVALLHRGESVPVEAGSRAEPIPAVRLTRREREVIVALALGNNTADLAERLGIRPMSARTYVQRVLCKLGAHSRAGAVARAVRLGLIDPDRFGPVAVLRGPSTVAPQPGAAPRDRSA